MQFTRGLTRRPVQQQRERNANMFDLRDLIYSNAPPTCSTPQRAAAPHQQEPLEEKIQSGKTLSVKIYFRVKDCLILLRQHNTLSHTITFPSTANQNGSLEFQPDGHDVLVAIHGIHDLWLVWLGISGAEQERCPGELPGLFGQIE